MKPYIVTLTAGQSLPLHVEGDFLHVLESPAAGVFISTDDAVIDVESYPGYTIEGHAFKKLQVTNSTAGTVDVTLMVALGARFERPAVSGNVNISTGHTYGTQTVGTTAATLGGGAGQIRLTVRAAKTNTATITIGTVAGTGIALDAGDSREIQTSAAVSFISTAAAQSLQYHIEVG